MSSNKRIVLLLVVGSFKYTDLGDEVLSLHINLDQHVKIPSCP